MSRMGTCFVLCLGLLHISCNNIPVKEKSNLEVSIRGKVIDQNGNPLTNVCVSLPSRDLYDTTGSDGYYQLVAEVSPATASVYEDSLVYEKDGQVISSRKLSSLIDTLPDLSVVQRDIWGELDAVNGYEVKSISAILSGDGIPESKAIPLWYNSASMSYSGFVYFVNSSNLVNFSVFILVYDQNDKLIARSPVVGFPSTAGNIKIPTMPAFNPPVLHAIKDTSVSYPLIKSVTITIDSASIKTANGIAKYYFWNTDGDWRDSTQIPSVIISAERGERKRIIWAVKDKDELISRPDTFFVNFLCWAPFCDSIEKPYYSRNFTQTSYNPIESLLSFTYGDFVIMSWGHLQPYAGLKIDLSDSHENPMDMSAYNNVSFTLKSDKDLQASFKIITTGIPNTCPSECSSLTGIPSYRKDFSIDTTWKQITINFDELYLPGWAPTNTIKFDKSKIESIMVEIGKENNMEITDGKLWIKDLKFNP